MACEITELRGEDGPEKFRRMFGPGQVEQHISQAIQTCWMMLPEEKKTVDEVEKQMRRVFERTIKNMLEDGEAFGVK
jgi:hypothetical protein